MKRLLFSIFTACICCSCNIMAEDVTYITFKMNDTPQTPVSYAIGSEVDRIVFDGSRIVVIKNGKTVSSFEQSSMDSFSFTGITDGIQMPDIDAEDAIKTLFTIDGRHIGGIERFKTLPKGVYIIRQGNTSRKIIKP